MKNAQLQFSKIKKKYLNFLKKQEIKGEPFYEKINQLKNFYIPICNSLYKAHILKKKTLIVGLSGGQGAGKTTIAKIIKIILKTHYGLNIINFSIDDFYKTRDERRKMSLKTHKLFLTRGVPGTHDTDLLKNCFKSLKRKKFRPFYLPKFNKSYDDRYKKSQWIKIKAKPDIAIFEGWCVGANNQTSHILKKPINSLEKKNDKDLIWRKKVNDELKNKYKKIFKVIDKLIFIAVPSFKYVYKWRLLQEKKLKLSSKGKKIMSGVEIKKFIMFYERITKHMLKELKLSADVILRLDKKHRLYDIRFK